MDSEVWKLYQDLLNKKYESVDDYLTSSPVEVTKCEYEFKPHITFGGMEITDFYDE